ncbi:hypothetical protein ZIOFF_005320 [Zingiber officinale]|uniref:Uncharacterized protein n=1 Tax=Zingiber officinale TaxID=94328 RepID=A0A8J5M1H0_ZINOF|nr:hypothetical protein ZIOFF_005320 [Zingiber officinale]
MMLITVYMHIDLKKLSWSQKGTSLIKPSSKKIASTNSNEVVCNIFTLEFFRYEYKPSTRDNRWMGDQAIIVTMEVDLTDGSRLVYIIPDIMLTIGDFYRNLHISIQTRGYDQWQHGEANLLITRGMVRRLSNTPNIGFAYKIQGVMEYLTSHDVRALPGRRYSTSSLQGCNWVIKSTQICIQMQPSEVNTRNLMDGRISLSFNNYITSSSARATSYNSKDEEIQSDEETFQTLAVLVEQTPEDPIYGEDDYYYNQDAEAQSFVLVHKISPYAVIPQQKSANDADFDLVASEPCVIKA